MKNQFLYILLFSCFWQISMATSIDSLALKTAESEAVVRIDSVSQVEFDLPNPVVVKRTLPRKFKNKYEDSDFVYEAELTENNWWGRFKEKLANFFQNLFNLNSSKSSQNFVDILLKTLAVLIIIVVIFFIVKAILNKEGQWIFGKSSDKRLLKIKDVEKNIHLIDFEKLIQETIKSGDSRLAIRYYYLWILKKMTEKQIIEWDLEKTNTDYVHEIKDAKLKENFMYLSYLYNNVWYGAFDIDSATFERVKVDFVTILKTI
uniref:DUF4129 domain-containing protein n=2 Tax=Flavobacterium sp. TaxID=239 RepID=UPI00404AA748